jgi:hypothetical protein
MSEALFRVGGVYRQRNGEIVRLVERPDWCMPGWVEAAFVDRPGGDGGRRLLDGVYTLPEDKWSLVPGELVFFTGMWVSADKVGPTPTLDKLEAEAKSRRFDALADDILEDRELYARLIETRGGCRCHISPPCFACCEPLTQVEADSLGLLEAESELPELVKHFIKREMDARDAAMIARDDTEAADFYARRRAFIKKVKDRSAELKAQATTAKPALAALTRVAAQGHQLGLGKAF